MKVNFVGHLSFHSDMSSNHMIMKLVESFTIELLLNYKFTAIIAIKYPISEKQMYNVGHSYDGT